MAWEIWLLKRSDLKTFSHKSFNSKTVKLYEVINVESLEQVNYSYIYSIHYCTISSYLLQHGKVIIPPHLVMKERRLRLNSEVLQNSTCGRVATMEVLQALEHKAR